MATQAAATEKPEAGRDESTAKGSASGWESGSAPAPDLPQLKSASFNVKSVDAVNNDEKMLTEDSDNQGM